MYIQVKLSQMRGEISRFYSPLYNLYCFRGGLTRVGLRWGERVTDYPYPLAISRQTSPSDFINIFGVKISCSNLCMGGSNGLGDEGVTEAQQEQGMKAEKRGKERAK